MIRLPAPIVVENENAFTLRQYDSLDLLILDHPSRTQDDPGYAFLIEWFRAQPEPWRWHCLFYHTPWPGLTPFRIVEEFSYAWYELVGDKDKGKRVATVDNNPITTSRYATESFQNIFPSRDFCLFEDLDEGIRWITRGYELPAQDAA